MLWVTVQTAYLRGGSAENVLAAQSQLKKRLILGFYACGFHCFLEQFLGDCYSGLLRQNVLGDEV